MEKYTMRKLAEDILRDATVPMRSQDIWAEAEKRGLADKVVYKGKTEPHLTLYNTLNGDIKNNEQSIFDKVKKSPALFILKENQSITTPTVIQNTIDQIEKEEEAAKVNDTEDYGESDLHPVLAMFVSDNDHFSCRVKTIPQQNAKRRKKSKEKDEENVKDKWTFPDLIGVYFPYKDYTQTTNKMIKTLNLSSLHKFYSFEMKKKITPGTLRENYFQAVSNSSWANEGYLVSPEISDDPEFMKELALLTNSFGIGIIKLDINNPKDSQILIPARIREELDFDMLDKLIDRSPDAKQFFDTVSASGELGRVLDQEIYDKVYTDEEFAEETQKGLKGLSGRKK